MTKFLLSSIAFLTLFSTSACAGIEVSPAPVVVQPAPVVVYPAEPVVYADWIVWHNRCLHEHWHHYCGDVHRWHHAHDMIKPNR